MITICPNDCFVLHITLLFTMFFLCCSVNVVLDIPLLSYFALDQPSLSRLAIKCVPVMTILPFSLCAGYYGNHYLMCSVLRRNGVIERNLTAIASRPSLAYVVILITNSRLT